VDSFDCEHRHRSRAEPSSPRLTLDDAIEIWRRLGRGEAQHAVAAHFRVNQGRISEIMNGKRFPEARNPAMSDQPK
jgi:hypothetical protein